MRTRTAPVVEWPVCVAAVDVSLQSTHAERAMAASGRWRQEETVDEMRGGEAVDAIWGSSYRALLSIAGPFKMRSSIPDSPHRPSRLTSPPPSLPPPR